MMRHLLLASLCLAVFGLGCDPDQYEICDDDYEACETWCKENAGRGFDACVLACDAEYNECVDWVDEDNLYD